MSKKSIKETKNTGGDKPQETKAGERRLLVVDLINATTPPRNGDGSPIEGALSAFQTLMAERTGRWSFTLSKAALLVEAEVKAYQAGHKGLLEKFGKEKEETEYVVLPENQEAFQAAYDALLKRYGTLKPVAKGQYTIPAENRAAFTDEFNKLLVTEVDWSQPKLPKSCFGDDSALTGADAMLLWWLVE